MRAPTGDGLQTTRTTLSWRRTVASAGAGAALVAHHAVVRERGWAAALLLLGAAIVPLGLGIAARSRHRRKDNTPQLVRMAAGSVALLALLALAAT